MEKFRVIFRFQLILGRPVSDYDRKVLNCYHETPVFYANGNREAVDIVDEAFEKYCFDRVAYRCVESGELIRVL